VSELYEMGYVCTKGETQNEKHKMMKGMQIESEQVKRYISVAFNGKIESMTGKNHFSVRWQVSPSVSRSLGR
jgi:hypothetical protein